LSAKSKTKIRNQASNLIFTEADWDFQSVPEAETVACCYWEYARESVSIRDAVMTVKTALVNQGKPAPETPEREAFRVTATRAFGLLAQTGLPTLFWTGLPFPEMPWQRIDQTKRNEWANVRLEDPTHVRLSPFQVTGDPMIASMLRGEAMKAHERRLALYQQLSQIDTGMANLDEATELRKKLSEQEQHPVHVAVRGEGGTDSFIAQINWHEFSKKQIKESFGKWVDAYFCPVAKESQRGHKSVDWRAKLERLGLLRLRSQFTFEDAKPFLKQLYPMRKLNDSRPPSKFNEGGECNREAIKAVDDFRSLFHFLDSVEMPKSWPIRS